jgi:pimeloyl-ACP methyl ester carboxylesterase
MGHGVLASRNLRIVLLPGMDGTGDLFAPFIEALGGRCDTLVINYPNDFRMGYAELADWVVAQLPTDDFVLLGESFSGPVATLVAGMRPVGLRGLILCATFVRNPRPLARAVSPLTRILPMSRPWAWLSTPLLIGLNASDTLRELYVRTVGGMSSKTMQGRLRSVLEVDASEPFARVDVPMLFLRATRDRLVPSSATDWMRRCRPDARVVEIDAPHGMLQASPSACAAAIEEFMGQIR